MSSVYEINAPGFYAQVTFDQQQGWMMAVNDRAFIPLTPEHFTEHELDLAKAVFSDPEHPPGLKLHLNVQSAIAARKKRTMLVPE